MHGIAVAEPRRALVLLAATASLSMIFIDITVVAVAGPAIGRELGLDAAGVAWIANAYIVTLAAMMAIGGRLGDLVGKRNAFLLGLSVFAAASALCGAANSSSTLIAGRVLQGLGACLMQPAASALVIEHYPAGERGKAMGVMIGISMSFFAIGPVAGGLVTAYAGWPWIFHLNLPVALAALGLIVASRAANRPAHDRSFDVPSALLLAGGLPLVVYTLQEGSKPTDAGPWLFTPTALAALAAGTAAVAAFVWRQLRVPRPLIDLRRFAEPRLRANILLIAITQFAMAPLVVLGSIYAQDVLGFSSSVAGLSLMPMLVPVILVARRAGRLYDRIGVRPLARGGTAVATAGLATWGAGSILESYPVIAAGMVLLGLGVAFIMSPASTDTLSSVDDETRGQVSGLVQTSRQVGGAVGVAFASLLSGVALAWGAGNASSIGYAILGGAAVAALGVVVALRMPHTPPPGAARAGDGRTLRE
jgi:EmrB/QacA subfamily drug resistance transporter